MATTSSQKSAVVSPDFNPGIGHPFYFVRSGLFKSISRHSHALRGRLMDFGCGSKPYRALFETSEYVGVDYQDPQTPHSPGNNDVDVYYDGNALPFPSESFDAVLCTEVLEHLFQPARILVEIHRVMKPEATLLVTCPFTWILHEEPRDFARYTPHALRSLLESAGFEIVQLEQTGTFVSSLCQLWQLYIWHSLLPKLGRFRRVPVLGPAFERTVFGVGNIFGWLLDKCLPNDTSLYLSNVALACKVRA